MSNGENKRKRNEVNYSGSGDEEDQFSEDNSEYIEDKKCEQETSSIDTSTDMNNNKQKKKKRTKPTKDCTIGSVPNDKTNKKTERTRTMISTAEDWTTEEDYFMNNLVSKITIKLNGNQNVYKHFRTKKAMAEYITSKLNNECPDKTRSYMAIYSRLAKPESKTTGSYKEAAKVFQSFDKETSNLPNDILIEPEMTSEVNDNDDSENVEYFIADEDPHYKYFNFNKNDSIKSIKSKELYTEAYNTLYKNLSCATPSF